ncbi:MAG TPA: pilus assembly protein TadG-related protein [Candidatus Limnocylindria bacterium]|nr:pilus assembly protein TadG-related protein [Candidatus Limnocylindria bacterium]
MNALRQFWSADGQGGQAVVLIGISLMAMLFAVGLAIDAGQLFVAKRTQQEAADAAAFAGAVQLYLGGTQADAKIAAIADATINGYTDAVNLTTVTVISPPTEGNFIGNNSGVEVTIVRQVKTTLVPAQSALASVRARSVAMAAPFASQFAIVALQPGAGPCITVSNTGGIIVPNGANLGGAIQANCTGTSIDLSGSGGITDPLGTNAVGSVTNPSRVLPAGSLITPAPVQRDPFAGFPKPPALPPFISSSQYPVPASACNAATPLQPGVYVGGIVNNQTCATVYLATGVYILKGGGFYQASSTNTLTNVPGGGAMIFNTHSYYADVPGTVVPGPCGGIVADSGGKFDIYAMTPAQSIQYAGMALYQDSACPNPIVIQSNGALNLHGTLYAPSALLDIQSQSSGTIDAQLVVRAISLSSSGAITVNYRPSQAAQTNLPALVE